MQGVLAPLGGAPCCARTGGDVDGGRVRKGLARWRVEHLLVPDEGGNQMSFETIRKVILEPNREAIEEVISRTC